MTVLSVATAHPVITYVILSYVVTFICLISHYIMEVKKVIYRTYDWESMTELENALCMTLFAPFSCPFAILIFLNGILEVVLYKVRYLLEFLTSLIAYILEEKLKISLHE